MNTTAAPAIHRGRVTTERNHHFHHYEEGRFPTIMTDRTDIERGVAPDDRHPDDAEAREAVAWLRRRREAAWRLPPLPSGYRDPWDRRSA